MKSLVKRNQHALEYCEHHFYSSQRTDYQLKAGHAQCKLLFKQDNALKATGMKEISFGLKIRRSNFEMMRISLNLLYE